MEPTNEANLPIIKDDERRREAGIKMKTRRER